MPAHTLAPRLLIDRLIDCVNRHDLDAMLACFAPDFVNVTPAHPARSFSGRDQVARNWAELFAGIPDIQVRLLGSLAEDERVWSEWEMVGTRRDGAPLLARGVMIFALRHGLLASVRFYLEPVEDAGLDASAAVKLAVGG